MIDAPRPVLAEKEEAPKKEAAVGREAPPRAENKPVDELITAVPGEWKFDRNVAKSFDPHIRKSVPAYDHVQEMVVEISEWFVRDQSKVYDIGSSTGETIKRLSERHRRKENVQFIGVETSAAMIEAARRKCSNTNVSFLQQDALELPGFPEATLVTIMYTLQFLTPARKRQLLGKIFDDLQEGAAVIVVDKVRGIDAFFDDMWRELHWDLKVRSGLSEPMLVQKARSLRGVMMPLTLDEDLALLESAGFTRYEVFFRWYNFVGIVAIKTA